MAAGLTVNSRIQEALTQRLTTAGIDHTKVATGADLVKLCKFLDQWITHGAEGCFDERVAAAQSLFTAKEGATASAEEKAITEELTNLQKSFTALLKGMTSSTRGVLGAIHSPYIPLIKNVLENAKGEKTSTGSVDPAETVQMNMLMKTLIKAAETHAKEDDGKSQAFSDKLHELLTINANSFTKEYIKGFKVVIEERELEKSLDNHLYGYRGQDGQTIAKEEEMLATAVRLLNLKCKDASVVQFKEGVPQEQDAIHEVWNKLDAKAKSKAQNDGTQFLLNVREEKLNGLNEPDQIQAIQKDLNKLDPGAQAFVKMKLLEHQTLSNLEKHETDIRELFGKMFGEGFFSKALVTAVMGFFGGSIFGSPMLGVFLTSIVSILGSLSESSDKPRSVPPAPAK